MKLVIKGQVVGGKNNMGVSQSGHHYPKNKFVEWRTQAEWQLKQQLKKMDNFEMIDRPINATFNYVSGDNRRRDCTAILDAVFHVLERMHIVEDDRLIGGEGRFLIFNFVKVDKKNPYIEIIFE